MTIACGVTSGSVSNADTGTVSGGVKKELELPDNSLFSGPMLTLELPVESALELPVESARQCPGSGFRVDNAGDAQRASLFFFAGAAEASGSGSIAAVSDSTHKICRVRNAAAAATAEGGESTKR